MAVLLARLARFSGRHRWWMLVGWVAVLLGVGATAVTGMKFVDGGFDVPGTNSSRAMVTLEQQFGKQEVDPTLQLVVQSAEHIESHAPALTAVRGELAASDDVLAVSDPFDPLQPYVSADGTTAVITVTFAELTEHDAEEATAALADVAQQLRDTGLTVEVGGSLASAVPEILGPSEIVGALIAFVVLILTFGSLVAAGANMVAALVSVGVGVLGVLAFSALSPIGTVTPILAVMLGLAVGIDYGLFILSRFRSELLAGRRVDEAVGRAVGTAGSAVVFAGATVVIALVGLTVVGIPFIGEMGIAAAFAVIVAVAMSLTLLPALMTWMGRSVLPRRARRRTTAETAPASGWATATIRAITRRPWAFALATIGVLAIAATPVLSMQTSLSTPGGEDPSGTQRAAYTLIAEEFGAGAQDPLVVLLKTEAEMRETATSEALTRMGELPGVASVIPVRESVDGTTVMLTVFSEAGPLAEDTLQVVRDIRGLDLAQSTLAVTGATAMGLDSDEQLRNALVLYVVLIVGLSLVLMILLFRSILVPVIATLGFLLSLGAGLGATVAIFQWGWLDAFVAAPQGNPLLSLLPIVVTGILFGLAMDYQVFLVSRIHEAYQHGLTPHEAVKAGFTRSAPVVVAAAAIMTAVFGGFALSPSSLVGSIALALAVGVIADAFLVRMIVVPATLAILGRAAWWLPTWLERILPRIDVEGAALDTPPLQHSGHAGLGDHADHIDHAESPDRIPTA